MKIDYKQLERTCLSPIEAFMGLGEVVDTRDGIYIFKDNGAKVLGVAHLDTVLGLDHFYKMEVNGDPIVLNAQLDDRLGAYALIHLLPSLGINFDLLLTEGEETGNSTAQHFKPSKEYNWMFSFDRHGDDVVLYQYESKVINDALKSSKFRIGKGSFSDIAFLDHLGIKGFNVGTGYEGEHTDMSYANMTTFKAQVERFRKFYDQNKDKQYKHDNKPVFANKEMQRYYEKTNHYPLQDFNTRGAWQKDDFSVNGVWVEEKHDAACYICRTAGGTTPMGWGVTLCDSCFSHAAECTECKDICLDVDIIDGLCGECSAWYDDLRGTGR